MFKCEVCDAVFYTPKTVSDNPADICGYTEAWWECPECGSERIIECIDGVVGFCRFCFADSDFDCLGCRRCVASGREIAICRGG